MNNYSTIKSISFVVVLCLTIVFHLVNAILRGFFCFLFILFFHRSPSKLKQTSDVREWHGNFLCSCFACSLYLFLQFNVWASFPLYGNHVRWMKWTEWNIPTSFHIRKVFFLDILIAQSFANTINKLILLLLITVDRIHISFFFFWITIHHKINDTSSANDGSDHKSNLYIFNTSAFNDSGYEL